MLHYIFVNDTGNISDNLTVRLIIFFGILHEDSYTISTSTGQKNETNVIATDLLSFRIKISRSGFMTYGYFFCRATEQPDGLARFDILPLFEI